MPWQFKLNLVVDTPPASLTNPPIASTVALGRRTETCNLLIIPHVVVLWLLPVAGFNQTVIFCEHSM